MTREIKRFVEHDRNTPGIGCFCSHIRDPMKYNMHHFHVSLDKDTEGSDWRQLPKPDVLMRQP